MSNEIKKAAKVRRLFDVSVVCDPPGYVGRWCRKEEDRAKELQDWCREFNDFIRDHRSQDGMRLSIKRDERDFCSACDAEWEPYEEGGKEICAHCGTEIETKATETAK